jgi:release factor glutamine methyltransferase
MIYQPEQDSFLLSELIKVYLLDKSKKFKILDMGSGSGFQAKTCFDLGFYDILCADINSEAVDYIKKQGLKSVKSNLFSKINNSYDLIIFNAPYLPEDKREPLDSRIATTAGKQGYEIIIKFLKQAKKHLNKNGTILLLFSSLSKPKIILKQAKELDYKFNLLKKEKLDFEELYVYEFF